jgi:hypothetical protein
LSLGLISPNSKRKSGGNSTAPMPLPRAHYSLLIPKSIMSLRMSRTGRSIRKRLFGILSETRWITLSKRSLRLCETMNPFDMSLESKAESPSTIAQTHRKPRWRTAWSK